MTFVVKRQSKYNVNLHKRHFRVVKEVVCYFKEMIYLELVYK